MSKKSFEGVLLSSHQDHHVQKVQRFLDFFKSYFFSPFREQFVIAWELGASC